MKLNIKPATPTRYTAEGAVASKIGKEQELRRTVMACMLWEKNFYEDGQDVATRIAALIPHCRPEYVAACAFEARTKMHLRHVPLLLVREMARLGTHKHLVKDLLRDVIQRPDEITEFLAIYWKEGKCPISAQVKKGLAAAFRKFDEYALAKYNRDGAVKLRDALFLCHSKPIDAQGGNKTTRAAGADGTGYKHTVLNSHEELYRKLVDNELATPDTWEVQLSAGADKKETFTRLMVEKKLGALAFLRNLRNMNEAGVDRDAINLYAETLKTDRVLPFRFLAAARYAPQHEQMLERLMMRSLENAPKLVGKTVLLVDVSGSMNSTISDKSYMMRVDAAYGLGILLREICEHVEIFTFSSDAVYVPGRRSFALRDAMHHSQSHGSTYLGQAINTVHAQHGYDRIIVITDEQSADRPAAPKGKGYVINVAANKNGVGYGAWNHIDGWSESVIDFIREFETTEQ